MKSFHFTRSSNKLSHSEFMILIDYIHIKSSVYRKNKKGLMVVTRVGTNTDSVASTTEFSSEELNNPLRMKSNICPELSKFDPSRLESQALVRPYSPASSEKVLLSMSGI